MSTAMKWVRGIALTVVAIVLLVAAAVAWLVWTNSGAEWLFNRAAAVVDGRLEAASIQGTLASELTFEDLHYAAPDSSLELRAQRLSVVLELEELLRGVLRIDSAVASGLLVSSQSSQAAPHVEEQPAPAPLQLPVDVIVEQLTVRSAAVKRDGKRVLDIQQLQFAGRWTDRGIVVDELDMEAQQGAVEVSGVLRHDQNVYVINASGDFRWQVGQQQVAGSLRADTKDGAVEIAVQLSAPTEAELVASIGQQNRNPWSFELDVPSFDPQLLGNVAIASLAASLQGRGTQAGGTVTGEIVVDGKPVRLHPLQFSISPERMSFELTADIGSAQGDLQANGEVLTGNDPWQADVKLSWTDVTLPPAWAGQTLDTRGELHLSGNLEQFSVQGELSLGPPGRVAQIEIQAAGSPENIRISELRVQQPSGYLTATGELISEPNLRWDLQAQASSFNPGALLPQWHGNLKFELDTQGSLTDAGPQGELLLRNLDGQLRGHPVSGSANLTLTTQPSLAGRLNLQSGASRVHVVADRGEAWDAVARFQIAELENWVPNASGSLSGRFSVSGEWPGLNVVGNARAERLQVAGASIDSARLHVDMKNPRAPSGSAQLEIDDVAIAGVVIDSATAEVSGSPQQHTLTLQANGSPGSMQLLVEGGTTGTQGEQRWAETIRRLAVDLRDMQPLRLVEPATLVVSDSWLDLSRMCLASSQARLCAAGKMNRPTAGTPTQIDGSITATIPDIAAAGVLSANVADVHGQVELDAEIDGTLADPALQIQLHAENLSAEIPRLGLHLRAGVLNAESRDGEQIAVSGHIQSGDGRLSVDGMVTTTGEANLDIEGKQLLAADIAGARVIAAPDLHFVRGAEGMLLEGRVRIPSAQINVQQLRRVNRVETGSPDIVIAGAKTRTSAVAEGIPLRADVTVVLGEEVRVSGFGLKAQLGGQVAIREAPGQPTTASGEVHAEGEYRAFGQDLSIAQGSILYAETPLDNPRLNIVATREVEDVTAGIRITGPAQNPELTVFADPAMDEANALSYLLAGRPLEDIGVSETQGDALNSAAESLGTAAGGLLAKRIGARLGLDTATVEENELLGTQVFTVGEFLSPRLYLSYGVGLFEPGDVVMLRYRLSDDVAVRAIRGPEESRIGIEYRVER